MKIRMIGCWFVFAILLINVYFVPKPISAQKPLFDATIDASDTSHSIEIKVDISGATDLYLVANDAGNSIAFDWADWLNPTLSSPHEKVSLTELKWKFAAAGFGQVVKNYNCVSGPLIVNDSEYSIGFGTHANSIIHFELPKGHRYTTFAAVAGLDKGGVSQAGGAKARVRFLVFTKQPGIEFFSVGHAVATNHSLDQAVQQFDVHDDLEVKLFAHEPMLVNPTNIDIDHLGRVWACEVVNYRNRKRSRKAGDRILVISDKDGDGVADQAETFYQGTDINSAHGICVLGDRVIVSAGSDVFYLIDNDGDLKADEKKILFTGISGVQHDHGIHAFVFGPDGKLYFNFGNEGRQICDANGNQIVDMSGNEVNDRRLPYQQGMVFRCNLDGTEFETLAWNFRNNWEVCVDSFGGMWQSDNDDDGNRATRINYVLPYGNYGFRDEKTGAGWRHDRSGKSKVIPEQHWHQNDPGVIPNLLITGAGSPTGICFYEGSLLPETFQNQMVHCDAGPNIVRSYVVEEQVDRAGFDVEVVNIMDGSKRNQWFRPSDVCVAPDGSLIVADWYDPGVGGHGMGDVEHGRLYRITPNGHEGYLCEKPDFSNCEGAIKAIVSPNLATRYLAYRALTKFGRPAVPALMEMTKSGEPHHKARAYWILDAIFKVRDPDQIPMIDAWNTGDQELRMMALRWSRQETDLERFKKFEKEIYVDEIQSAAVLRELAVCLHQRKKWGKENRIKLWVQIAKRLDAGDRWLVEALGVGAKGMWNRCLKNMMSADSLWDRNPAIQELVWRSRAGETTIQGLMRVIEHEDDEKRIPNLFRSMDFVDTPFKETILGLLTYRGTKQLNDKQRVVAYEAIKRSDFSRSGGKDRIFGILEQFQGMPEFVELLGKFKLTKRYGELLPYVCGESKQLAVDSIKLLASGERMDLLSLWMIEVPDNQMEKLVQAASISNVGQVAKTFNDFVGNSKRPLERRKLVIRSMVKIKSCCLYLTAWVRSGEYDKNLESAIAATLHSSQWPEFRKFAQERFPISAAKGGKTVPSISKLIGMRGDAKRGKRLFEKEGTCAKCHVVGGEGIEIGPNLTEIGSKLSRSAMYESILFPSAGISHGYENWMVLTLDGVVIYGLKTSETSDEVQIRDAENILHKIDVSEIDEIKQQNTSLMPDDLHQAMTPQQLVDLIEYMMTLKKK